VGDQRTKLHRSPIVVPKLIGRGLHEEIERKAWLAFLLQTETFKFALKDATIIIVDEVAEKNSPSNFVPISCIQSNWAMKLLEKKQYI
jgi:hypothetical protein